MNKKSMSVLNVILAAVLVFAVVLIVLYATSGKLKWFNTNIDDCVANKGKCVALKSECDTTFADFKCPQEKPFCCIQT
jgi:hypothetical protein